VTNDSALHERFVRPCHLSLRRFAGSVAPFQLGHCGFQVGVPGPLLQRPHADALFLMIEGRECLAELVQFPCALDVVCALDGSTCRSIGVFASLDGLNNESWCWE
jgi:hypothetical protein